METDKLKWSAFGVQCWATFCISFLSSQTGFVYAWPSYTIANFTSNDTLLATPMTKYEVSLLGSLSNVGSMIAAPFCGYVFNTLGRKYATVFFGLPYALAWLMISLTNNTKLILSAVTLGGVGVAGQMVSLIFISEISHDSIRGALTASASIGYYGGVLISYILGGHLSYFHVAYTHLGLSVLCIILLLMLKESPVYFMLKGKEEEAAKSVAFYNQVDVKSKLVEVELRRIKLQLDPRIDKLLELENVSDIEMSDGLLKEKTAEENLPGLEPSWKILLKSKSSKRALFTVLIILAATTWMGLSTLQVYAENIFEVALPTYSPNRCSIFMGMVFLVASVVCTLVIDRLGRKFLYIVAGTLSGFCALLLGVQFSINFAPLWFTATLLYSYSFINTIGCATLPFVLAAEVFLPEVRGLCNGISMGFMWIATFITLYSFNPIFHDMGLGVCFFIFSTLCFLGSIYAYFMLPETKGLSADAIQLKFLKIKSYL